MTAPTCPCGRPTSGAVLCDHCAYRTLLVALKNIAVYYEDLDIIRTRIRAIRYDQFHGKGGSKETPLPIDPRFADRQRRTETGAQGDTSPGTLVADDTRNTVATWARVVLDEWPPLDDTADTAEHADDAADPEARLRRPPEDTVTSCCAYLVRMLRHIASAPWAPQLLDELLDTESRLRRVIDVPQRRWYAGPCTVGQDRLEWTVLCGADLYAALGEPEVTCRACGWTYTIAERRTWLLTAAEDQWETASAIARAVINIKQYDGGESRLLSRIDHWSRDGRLKARDTVPLDGRDRPRYRVGDVLDLLAEDAQRKARHAEKKQGRPSRKGA